MTGPDILGQKFGRRAATVTAVLLALAMGGCGSNSVLGEPGAEQPTETAEAVVAGAAEEMVKETGTVGRGWAVRSVGYHSGEVEHLALYLQDPFEGGGSEDGYFQTWCFDDALAAAGGPAIFMGRAAGVGLEAAFAPPWQVVHDHGNVAPQEPAYALPAKGSGMTNKEGCQ